MLTKDIRVIIVSHDFYVRNWVSLILSRDLRTRVVAELQQLSQIQTALQEFPKVDLILIDCDLQVTVDTAIFSSVLSALKSEKVILIANSLPDLRILDLIAEDQKLMGYLIKAEICYSLAWAAVLVIEAGWSIITPGVQNFVVPKLKRLRRRYLVVDGRQTPIPLTQHEMNVARLAFIFSMERRELADELGITEKWGYSLISRIYQKLGLKELVAYESSNINSLDTNQISYPFLIRILKDASPENSVKAKEIVAYHFITAPVVLDFHE